MGRVPPRRVGLSGLRGNLSHPSRLKLKRRGSFYVSGPLIMKQIPLYSLVIFPTPEQLALVKSYKQLLRNEIGWFGSFNAMAHITVIQFDDEFSFNLHIERIRRFCGTTKAESVILNHFDSFGERTFFIAPNETSQAYLNQIIIDLHHYIGFNIKHAHAHLSIARGLDAMKMKKTHQLFQNIEVNLQFDCDAIFVRRFDEKTKQYSDVIEKICFEK